MTGAKRTGAVALGLFLTFLLPTLLTAGASREPVRAKNGMVVSSQRMASEVGVEVLKKGGTAVDAAIATGFALAVTLPSAGNVGGGGFMLVRTAEGEVTAFDFREKAPAAAHERMFLDENGEYSAPTNHVGYLSIGVPGTVAGFFLAHERFGKLPMEELLAPAIELADKGFPVSWRLADRFERLADTFRKYPATAEAFLREDRQPYQAGEVWKQPELARTLRRIQKGGRAGFYQGETARLLAAAMKKHGGLVTEGDLAAYETRERTPVHGTYRGYDVYSMYPPSSGGVALLEMLNILEGFDLAEAGFGSALHFHLLAESMRHAFADRARYIGDPDFNPDMPVDRLISKDHARTLRRTISLNRASESSPVFFNDVFESDETTHYSVMDAQGNAVVVTYTLERGFGSKIVAEGTGFLLNNEMGDFNPQPGRTDETGLIGTKPNLVQPGKRMISSMTPTIVVKDDKPFLLIGTPGGRTIMNTVLQVIVNVIDFKMDMAEAIAAPRVHHQWLPDRLRIERFGASPDTIRLLKMMGHDVQVSGTSRAQGRAMGIMVDAENGLLTGAADPRAADGGAVGY